MDIVVFGQQNWDVTWTEKQQFATRLAARGHRVLYVDPDPVAARGVVARARGLLARPSGGELRRLPPHALWLLSLAGRDDAWRRPRAVRHAARGLGFERPAVLTLHPQTLPAIRPLHASGVVYYAVDEWTGFFDDPALARQVRADEEALLRESDVAIGISPRLQRRFGEVQPHAYLLTNGVDAEQFGPERLAALPPHPVLRALPRPRLGLIGQIDRRVNQELLHTLADAHPEWQLVLVGRVASEVDVSALAARPNVHLLGFQPHEQLPQLLRELDVCLIPYHLTALTHSCNPAKAYEYLATGLPIVATPLEGLGELREVVHMAGTPDEFVRAAERALRDGPAGRAERLALAAGQGWEQRTDVVEARLREAMECRGERLAAARARTGDAARGRAGERLAPLLDAKEDSDQRAQRHFADDAFSPRARLALRGVRAAGMAYWAARVTARIVSGRRPWRVRRILVARRAFLGDLVVFLPTLAALRARFPSAHVTLGVHRGFTAGGILVGTGLVDEVRELDFLDAGRGWRRLVEAVRLFARGYDLVVHGANFFLLREAFFTGAPRAAGLDDGHPLQAELDVRVPLQPHRHEAENNLAVAEALGGVPTEAERVPQLVPPGRVAGVDVLLARLGIPPDAPVLAMHPGSKRPSRRWPVPRFAELAASLLAERPTAWIVLTGVGGEHALAESIRQLVPAAERERVVNAAGACSLDELRLLLARTEALVCNDTGVMHVARAQGTRLVALLGPENSWRWGPHALGPAPALAVRHEVPCAPCARNECEYLWCLRSLGVREARAAVTDVLRASAPPGRDALVPLERRRHRHSWTDLAEAGYELPLVSVLVAGPPGDAWVRDTLARLAAQRYPRLEALVLVSSDAVPAASSALPVLRAERFDRVLTVRGSGEPAAWAAALQEARGEFVCAVTAAGVADWDAGTLDDDVAALVRMPEAALTSSLSRLVADGPMGDAEYGSRGRTFRREALAAVLAASRGPAGDLHPAHAAGQAEPWWPDVLDVATPMLVARHPTAASRGFVQPPA